jgi:hypothetical protein
MYVIYAPFIQRIINYKTNMNFGYDGKHGAYQPHNIWRPIAPPPPPPPAANLVGPSAATPASPPARAPLVAPESSRVAVCWGKKHNVLIRGIKILISMCRSNDALIRESHRQMS